MGDDIFTMKAVDVVNAARRVNATTICHIDGHDLLDKLHHVHTIDITVRKDGQDYHYEGDWLSKLWREVRELRRTLAALDLHTPQPRHEDIPSAQSPTTQVIHELERAANNI